jgi:predicted chitinase
VVHDVDDATPLIARRPEAIANRVYANRLGNGWRDSDSGMEAMIGTDLEGQPELARAV